MNYRIGILLVCMFTNPLFSQTSVGTNTGATTTVTTGGQSGGQSGTTTGTYTTSGGGTVTWIFTYRFSFRFGVGSWKTNRPANEPISGPWKELVTSDNEVIDHPNAQILKYEKLIKARDEMRGVERPTTEDGYAHFCDNPDCPYLNLGQLKEEPFHREVAEWAIGSYGSYLQDNPEDWLVLREFAIAVGLMNDLDIAIEIMHSAYLNSPDLGFDPFDSSFLGIDETTFRSLLVKCVKHAQRDPTAARWFMVAMLMQAEGRYERSGEMLQRAIDLGLEQEIVDEFMLTAP
jgi:hypothetical protein